MGFSAQAYESADEFWRSFDPSQSSCIIFDGRTTVGGVSLAECLAREPLAPPLIYVSDETNVTTVVRAIRQGALEFLQKRAYSETDLWEAIQRGLALDAAKRINHARLMERQARIASLSEPERQVLRLLLLGKNNREIALECGISRVAAEGRRTRMMKKLGVTNLVALVRCAIEAGFEGDRRLGV